jgi:hypothetical protein
MATHERDSTPPARPMLNFSLELVGNPWKRTLAGARRLLAA